MILSRGSCFLMYEMHFCVSCPLASRVCHYVNNPESSFTCARVILAPTRLRNTWREASANLRCAHLSVCCGYKREREKIRLRDYVTYKQAYTKLATSFVKYFKLGFDVAQSKQKFFFRFLVCVFRWSNLANFNPMKFESRARARNEIDRK